MAENGMSKKDGLHRNNSLAASSMEIQSEAHFLSSAELPLAGDWAASKKTVSVRYLVPEVRRVRRKSSGHLVESTF